MRVPALSVTAAVLAVSAIAAGDPAGAAPRRTGRVVRVPRPPLVLSTAVRTCSIFDEGIATCDRPVQIGEVGAVIDEEQNRGAATIRGVEPQTDGCGTPVIWKVSIELQASASGADPPKEGMFVLDFALEERAHTLSPSSGPREGERVVSVIDRDGDGDGDLRISQYSCDYKGVLDRTPRPSHLCTDYWLAVRDRWQRARSDRAAVCDR